MPPAHLNHNVGPGAVNLPTETAKTAGRKTGNILEALGLRPAQLAELNRAARFGWRLKRWAVPGVVVLSWLVYPTLTPDFRWRWGLPGGVAPPPEDPPEEEG